MYSTILSLHVVRERHAEKEPAAMGAHARRQAAEECVRRFEHMGTPRGTVRRRNVAMLRAPAAQLGLHELKLRSPAAVAPAVEEVVL